MAVLWQLWRPERPTSVMEWFGLGSFLAAQAKQKTTSPLQILSLAKP